MDISELQGLKEKIEKTKSEYDVARGKLQSIKADIEQMGFKSIRELQEAIERMTKDIEAKDAELTDRLEAWKEKYGNLIG